MISRRATGWRHARLPVTRILRPFQMGGLFLGLGVLLVSIIRESGGRATPCVFSG